MSNDTNDHKTFALSILDYDINNFKKANSPFLYPLPLYILSIIYQEQIYFPYTAKTYTLSQLLNIQPSILPFIDISNPPHPVSPLHFIEYVTDMGKLSIDQINRRMIVIKNFLFYQEKTFEAILQIELNRLAIRQDFICVYNTIIYIRETFCPILGIRVAAGFWMEDTVISTDNKDNDVHYGFDIISLYTFLFCQNGCKYSDALDMLYSFYNSRDFINRSNSLSQKEFYVQEKNPLSLVNPVFFDTFFAKFDIKHITQLYNSCKRLIAWAYTIFINGQYHDFYYTFWRHKDSVFYNIYPLPPQKPLELYFMNSPNVNTNNDDLPYIYICDDLNDFYGKISKYILVKECYNNNTWSLFPNNTTNNKNINYQTMRYALIPGSTMRLTDAIFSDFSNKTFIIDYKETMSLGYLKSLRHKINEYNPNECLLFYHEEYKNIDEIIKIKQKESKAIKENIINTKENIPGSNRIRTMLLDPIIESGTITWLFAQEKAGKTLLGLTIAQLVGTGDLELGYWKAHEARRVLYIDGEMPGDKVDKTIKKIIAGLGYDNNQIHRSFDICLFYEQGLECENLLDSQWQEENYDELLEYDLIIFDNYYSLYENSQNALPFLRWLKHLTKHNIACLVLDHTNSEGELQGSIVKRRAMDLGIHLELDDNAMVNIKLEYDRYGRSKDAPPFAFIPHFTSSEISFEICRPTEDNEDNPDMVDVDNIKTLYILCCKKSNPKLTNKQIANDLDITDTNVTRLLHSIGRNYKLELHNNNAETQKKYKQIVSISEKLGIDVEQPLPEDLKRLQEIYEKKPRDMFSIIKQIALALMISLTLRYLCGTEYQAACSNVYLGSAGQIPRIAQCGCLH